jgi:hypothetical protein
MKLFNRLFLALSIILIISSCSRIVYISRRVDPKIILNNDHHNIVFVNLFDYMLADNVSKSNRISYHAGVMNLLDGLSSFSNDSSYSFLMGDTLKKGIEKGLLTTLLPVDTISRICTRFNSNLLLALDSASIFFDRDTVENNYFGRSYRIINFYLNTRFFLSLYSAGGDLIDRSEVDQSIEYKPRSAMSGLIILVPSVPGATDVIGNLAYQAGMDYIDKFYPQYIHDTKELFTDKPFKESNGYFFAKNWVKARELLEQLTKDPDLVIAGKARHNLEVLNEAADADARK